MKINLSETIKKLNGKPLYKESAGVLLANYMMEITSATPVRMFNMAMKLVEDKEIEATVAEVDMMVAVIKPSNMQNLVKAHLLNAFGAKSD